MAAFWYDLMIPDLGINESTTGGYRFVKWLVPDKSNIQAGTALAIVSNGVTQHLLRNAGPGLLTQWNWKVQPGDEVFVGQTIGRLTTEGELIPYGRPYVTAEPVS